MLYLKAQMIRMIKNLSLYLILTGGKMIYEVILFSNSLLTLSLLHGSAEIRVTALPVDWKTPGLHLQ